MYFAGYGLQLEGENYLVPTDAEFTETSDVSRRAVRLSEQTHALAALHLKTSFMILDVARAGPFILSGQPPAGGLAWVEPETNMLIAFNAAPGTVSPDDGDGYGPYAKALTEMIREGGLTPANVFDRVRLRVNELTKGAQVPWHASNTETQFMFLERGPGAPPRADSPGRTAWMRSQPMRSLGAHDAYMVALMRDTSDAYADFLADYWNDPMTKRVRALLAARREAITWRRTYQANVSDAYASYLERYPHGPHVADARRLLARLGATIAPPFKLAMMDYEVAPPLPDELEYIERNVLVFGDPVFAFDPPPPSPVYFLEPPPPELLALAPPAASPGSHLLPTPKFVSLPAYVSVPAEAVQDGRAVTSSLSPPGMAGNTNKPIAGLPPSVALEAALINSRRSPQPPAMNPVASEDIKAPLRTPVPTVALEPSRPAGNETTASLDIKPPALSPMPPPLAIGSVPLPVPRPATLAPPSTAMPLPTRRVAMPSRETIGGVARPIAHVRLPTGTQLPAQRAATPPSEAAASVPLPMNPPQNRNRSKPIKRAVSAASPTEVNQPAQRRAPPIRLAPTQLGQAPKVTSGASPPKPQGKPCTIVDGRLIC